MYLAVFPFVSANASPAFFFFNDPATTEISPLPLPDALPIFPLPVTPLAEPPTLTAAAAAASVTEDGTVGLNITATAAESDADATTTVTITGVPTNASLNHGTHNTDGS